MHDFVIIFLFSILLIISVRIIGIFFFNSFDSEFFENHQIENVWTILPFFILVFIIVSSIGTLYSLDICNFCGLTINIIGHQWYWSYFYKNLLRDQFDSYILPQEIDSVRLLETDNRVLIPSNFPLRFIVSSSDVIHSWTIPSFGIKIDAIPGRLNQFCSSIKQTGLFFGQCSEICGANHSFIPIVLESIYFDDFNQLCNLSSNLFKIFVF